ncbi:hypothetical protein Q7C36_000994 [Tachysurus vachellii]|uniref:Uncharacterized protein n=1 Tax=Tachysurus vachellii TaxID=175792 RepID=A0AA88NX12_TACVA|nr:hypothetical protein Q7C36_000994 [Tachysurus vachellii]
MAAEKSQTVPALDGVHVSEWRRLATTLKQQEQEGRKPAAFAHYDFNQALSGMKQILYEEAVDLVTGRKGATVKSTHSVLIKDDIHLAC